MATNVLATLPVRNAVSVVIGRALFEVGHAGGPDLRPVAGAAEDHNARHAGRHDGVEPACSSGDTPVTSAALSTGSDADGSVTGGAMVDAAAESGAPATPATTTAPTSVPSTSIRKRVVDRWQRAVMETLWAPDLTWH